MISDVKRTSTYTKERRSEQPHCAEAQQCLDKQPKQTDPAGATTSCLLFGEVILICFAYYFEAIESANKQNTIGCRLPPTYHRNRSTTSYYSTAPRRVQITPKTSANITRYLYSRGPVRQVCSLLTNQLAGFPAPIPFRFAYFCHAFPVNKYPRNSPTRT